MLDPQAFKAYDVRGLYPSQLDEEGAYAIGRAFVEQFEPASIAVGRDVRLSSPSMASAVIEGAADGGADVLDLGMVGTEMVYFAVGELALDGGVMVTASHNPKQYSTKPVIIVGICNVCHPFYTGQQKFVDTAGRVDKFQQRLAKTHAAQAAAAVKRKKK